MEKLRKQIKVLASLKKIQPIISLFSLITIYKSFVEPLLDYGNIIYDQPNNASLSDKIKSVEYNLALAITGGY